MLGEQFEEVHSARETFLFFPKDLPIYQSPDIDIYLGQSSVIFYRGIAAYTPTKSCNFTYNIKSKQDLTEDRTLKYHWYADRYIKEALTASDISPELLFPIINTECYERSLDFSREHWSENFIKTVASCVKHKPMEIDANLRQHYYALRGKLSDSYVTLQPSGQDRERLHHAIIVLKCAGFDVMKYEIKLVENLGDLILGMAIRTEKKILLSKLAFSNSCVIKTLLEEFIHLEFDVQDETRDMQDVLLREIVRLIGGYKHVKVSPKVVNDDMPS